MTEDRTKPCDRCGKRMIRHDTERQVSDSPPQYVWEWWCGCGWREWGGVLMMNSNKGYLQKQWERANGEAQ